MKLRADGFICLFKFLSISATVYFQKFENGKIISEIVGICGDWDQNVYRVSKSDKSYHKHYATKRYFSKI